MTADRIRCEVPGCRRTCRGSGEWICGRHWRAVPKVMRAELAVRRRALRRQPNAKTGWLFGLQWDRCRDEAIAQALMGLS